MKKRIDIIGIAAALVAAGAGGFTLATASSSASDDSGAPAATLQIAAAADPALASTDPGDSDAAAKLAYVTGVAASDATAAPQTWTVGDHSVLGYMAADGRFCFEFRSLGGGCLQPGVLTDDLPVDVTTDYGPGTFQAYGLTLDGVTAVTLSIDGSSRPAALAHNAFYFSDDALGGRAGITGDVVATMSDGTTRAVPFTVGSMEDVLASP